MCSPLCVFVVDVPKKANAFGGKIRRKPNPKGAQASTRVIPNAPPVRFQSVCRAICRRPSWHVWACPSLTEARPSPVRQKPVGKPVCRPLHVRCTSVGESSVISPWRVRFPSVASPPPRHRPSRNVAKCRHQTNARPSAARQKSVAGPWRVRRVSRSDHSHGRLWTRRRPQSAASPCEPPRTNATRTNTRRTPHRKRPNAERTTDEHIRARSTSDPLNSADRQSPVDSPFAARISSVSCPCAVRQESVLCLCAARV